MGKTACKLCIAQKGLRGIDVIEGKCDYVFNTEEEFIEHLGKVHGYKIIRDKDGKSNN
jgi:hypothetical protein